jgi:hypothetical protein
MSYNSDDEDSLDSNDNDSNLVLTGGLSDTFGYIVLNTKFSTQ